MGEVYSANDANLGRQVALKILPSNRTSDPERVARFVREAQASSALNHPAIVSVHDAGSEGNVHFLAMELINGESLANWMRTRRSNLRRGIELMAQVAEGLDRAHAHGIIHRDLKPDNIMVSRDGYAKIVDFGIAKLTERLNGNRGNTGVTTPTSRVGTTAYMSPEVVEGRVIDHRSDVFSFGVVLYELMTGANPFAAEQYADTLHNILHLEPSLDRVPAPYRRIVRRCLRKDPEQRYQSMKDAALDLREAEAENGDPAAKKSRMGLAIAAVLLVALTAAAGWYFTRADGDARAASMVMTRLTNSGKIRTATVSPDGRYLVYAENVSNQQGLYVKQVATGTTTTILEPAPNYYIHLRVSPDGNYVYYSAAHRDDQNVVNIFQVPLLGGTPRKVSSDTEEWFSLSPDGQQIVFRRFNAFDRQFKMTIASVDDGSEEVVLVRMMPDFIDTPVWAPDGRSITFISGNAERKERRRVRRLTLATGDIEVVPTPHWPGVGSYAWLPDGSGALLTAYERDQPPQIWFVPTGSETGRKVTSEVSAYYAVAPTADSASFVAVRDTTDSNVYTLSLDDPQHSLSPVTSGVGNFWGSGGVAWLDGRVAYSGIDAATNTYFVADADGSNVQRLIRNVPAWMLTVSPDDRSIAFVSDKSGQSQIWIADSNGENSRQLTAGERALRPYFSADGRFVIYITAGASQYAWRMPVDGSGTPEQLTFVPTSRVHPSPDGQWLLGRLRTTGEDGGPLWRTALVRMDGKGEPRFFNVPRYGSGPWFQWHPSSESFLYLDSKDGVGNLWMQPVDGSEPRQLTSFASGEIFNFDLAADGRSLLISRGEPTRDAVLVRNWR